MPRRRAAGARHDENIAPRGQFPDIVHERVGDILHPAPVMIGDRHIEPRRPPRDRPADAAQPQYPQPPAMQPRQQRKLPAWPPPRPHEAIPPHDPPRHRQHQRHRHIRDTPHRRVRRIGHHDPTRLRMRHVDLVDPGAERRDDAQARQGVDQPGRYRRRRDQCLDFARVAGQGAPMQILHHLERRPIADRAGRDDGADMQNNGFRHDCLPPMNVRRNTRRFSTATYPMTTTECSR